MIDLRNILSIPSAYSLFGKLVSKKSSHTILLNHIEPFPGAKILDIGCGPGSSIKYLPDYISYTGFDISADYIKKAKKKYPNKNFICSSVKDFSIEHQNQFDRVIAIGVLHHLNDSDATKLIETSFKALKPKGKLITYDGVWIKNQNLISTTLLKLDRGEYIRFKKSYINLISKSFKETESRVYNNLLRIPHSSLITNSIK